MIICSRPHLVGYSGPQPSWTGIPGDDGDVPGGEINLQGVSVDYAGVGDLDWFIDVDGGTQFSGTADVATINAAFLAGSYNFTLGVGSYVVTFHLGRAGAGFVDVQSVNFTVNCSCGDPEITTPAGNPASEPTSSLPYTCVCTANSCTETLGWDLVVDSIPEGSAAEFAIDADTGEITGSPDLSGDYVMTVTAANECSSDSVVITFTEE